jgi:hypothetical protein
MTTKKVNASAAGRNTPRATVLAEHASSIRAIGKQTIANVIEIGRRLTATDKQLGHARRNVRG